MSETTTKLPVVFWDTEKDPYANNVKVLNPPGFRLRYFITDIPQEVREHIVDVLAIHSANWQSVQRDDWKMREVADQAIVLNTRAAQDLGMLARYARTFALHTAWPGENTRYVATQESL